MANQGISEERLAKGPRDARSARVAAAKFGGGTRPHNGTNLSMSSDTDDDSQFKRYNSSCMCARQTWALQKQYAARAVLPTPTAQDTTYRHAQQTEAHQTLPTRTLHSVRRRMVQSFGKYGLERNGPRASWPASTLDTQRHTRAAHRAAPRRTGALRSELTSCA